MAKKKAGPVTEEERELQRKHYIKLALRLLERNCSQMAVCFTTMDGTFCYDTTDLTYGIGASARLHRLLVTEAAKKDVPPEGT